MRSALLIPATVAALAIVTTAGASGTKVYSLQPRDLALVKGTHVLCGVSVAKAFSCVYLVRNRYVPGSYAISLSATFARVLRATPKHGYKAVVTKDQPGGRAARSAAQASGKTYAVGAGDQLNIHGTGVWCSVNASRPVSVSCFKLSSKLKPIVGTYTVVIDDDHAGLLKVTSSAGSGQFKVLVVKKQP